MSRRVKGVTKATLQSFLKQHSAWESKKHGTEIVRVFTFPDFVSGLTFIARIAVHAEVAEHHPDLTLSYGKVKVRLSTHDVGTVTLKDINLAKQIDALYQ